MENVDSLMALALSEHTDVPFRYRVIKTFLQFLPRRLTKHSLEYPDMYAPYKGCYDFWARTAGDLQHDGVLKRGLRVCCDEQCVALTGFRRDGSLYPVRLKVLPERLQEGSELSAGDGCERDQLRRVSRRWKDRGLVMGSVSVRWRVISFVENVKQLFKLWT